VASGRPATQALYSQAQHKLRSVRRRRRRRKWRRRRRRKRRKKKKRRDTVNSYKLTFQSLAVSLRTTRFNIQKFYMVLALRSVFCTDLRTDSVFSLTFKNLASCI
jgi:hypothetical protein